MNTNIIEKNHSFPIYIVFFCFSVIVMEILVMLWK